MVDGSGSSDWVLVDEIEQRSIGKLLWSIIDFRWMVAELKLNVKSQSGSQFFL